MVNGNYLLSCMGIRSYFAFQFGTLFMLLDKTKCVTIRYPGGLTYSHACEMRHFDPCSILRVRSILKSLV
jgi:hypothetical protein